jgi:hypothetical protein
MGLKTRSVVGYAPCWAARKSQTLCKRKSGEVCGQRLSAGGFLSPLLCSLFLDELKGGLDENCYYTLGYADDIVFLIRGKLPNPVSEFYSRL